MRSKVKCPTCRAETEWDRNPHRPFCSERCRLIDLGAWVEGRYRVAGKKWDSEREEEEDGSDPDESS